MKVGITFVFDDGGSSSDRVWKVDGDARICTSNKIHAERLSG